MSALAGIPYVLVAFLGGAFLWGSIMAFRGRRSWATVLLMLGSGAQVIGGLLLAGGMVVMMNRVMGVASSAGSGSASAMASGMSTGIVIMSVGGILLGLGYLLFAGGFVGFCARYRSAERRAAELEGMVLVLQSRIAESS